MNHSYPDVVILTIIKEEFNAVKEVFEKAEGVNFTETSKLNHRVISDFWEAKIKGLTVYLVKAVDRGNLDAASLTQRIIDHWEPQLLLVVGIGGGVKDSGKLCGGESRKCLSLGDVVYSKNIWYYGYQNVENGKIYIRDTPLTPPSSNLRSIVQPIEISSLWKKYIIVERPDGKSKTDTKAHEGIILSGENIVNYRKFVRKIVCPRFEREKCIVFETEGAGVARAIYDTIQAEQPSYLVIRGISDFVDVEEDYKTRGNWKIYAAQAAAAFAYEIVKKIGESKLNERKESIQPYLDEGKKLFEEKIPVDKKALKEYYVPPETRVVDKNTWDMKDVWYEYEWGIRWNFKNFLRNSNLWYVIIGAPFGTGKTTYVKHLAYEVSSNFDKYEYVPIFIRLREWSDNDIDRNSVTAFNGELVDNVIGKIEDSRAKPLLILDGLDEYNGNVGSIYRWITTLHGKHPNLKVIITTRLKAGTPEELHFDIYVRILPFNENQIKKFFAKYGLSDSDMQKAMKLGLNDEDLRKPLFCWMIAMAISQIGSMEDIIVKGDEEKKAAFFYYILMHLLLRGKHQELCDERYLPLYETEKEFLRLTAAFFNMKEGVVKDNELIKWIKRVNSELISTLKNEWLALGRNISESEIEVFEPFLTSYFYIHKTTKGRIVEFIHQSFQEYFLAEYYYENIRDGNVEMLNVGIPSEQTIKFLKGLVKISDDENALKKLGEIGEFLTEFFDVEKQKENAKKIVEEETIVINKEFYTVYEKKSNFLILSKREKDIDTLSVHRWIALTSLTSITNNKKRVEVDTSALVSLIKKMSHLIPEWLKNLEGTKLTWADLRWAKLSKANLSGADLTKADLIEAKLSGTDLTKADLSGANLSGANLRKADLSDANLSGANLRWADLSEANLRKADLSGTKLSDANLSGANLRWADLSEANLRKADLTKAYLTGANLSGTDLTKADLSGAKLTWADLRGAKLSKAKLTWADLRKTDLRGAKFIRAYLSEVDFRKANLSGANLRGANLSGADLTKADLSGAKLSGAGLTKADLIEANLSGTDLTKADLSGANIHNVRFNILPIGLKTIKLGRTTKEVIETLLKMDESFRSLILRENPEIRKIWEEYINKREHHQI